MKIQLKKSSSVQAPYERGVIYQAEGHVSGLVSITLPNGKIVREPNAVIDRHFELIPA